MSQQTLGNAVQLAICGSRTITNYEIVKLDVLDAISGLNRRFGDDATLHVVSGCATGVDEQAETFATEFGYPYEEYQADWNGQGRAAGPIRNREMASASDVCVAIWDGNSPGTKNMIETSLELGLEVHVYIHND